MKRDWTLIRAILAHTEKETLGAFLADIKEPVQWTEWQYFSEHYQKQSEARKAKKIILEHIILLLDSGHITGLWVESGLQARGIMAL
jgi:endonuclease I